MAPRGGKMALLFCPSFLFCLEHITVYALSRLFDICYINDVAHVSGSQQEQLCAITVRIRPLKNIGQNNRFHVGYSIGQATDTSIYSVWTKLS